MLKHLQPLQINKAGYENLKNAYVWKYGNWRQEQFFVLIARPSAVSVCKQMTCKCVKIAC